MSSLGVASASKSLLRPLSLEPLVPQQLSSRGHVLTAFKKIDAVRVVRNPDQSSDCKYAVEVFSGRLRSRIPTVNGPVASLSVSSAGSSASRQPTATVTKSLDDFVDLRSQLYNVAHASHSKAHCDFCREMIEYALWGNPQPNAVARLFGDDEKMLQSLTKFVGALVPMIESGCSTPTGGSMCRAQAKIPRVVHEFLFGPSSERD